MDIEVRRNLVHRPITGTCRADAVALCLSWPPPAPPSSRAYLRHSDRQTPPPRRFAARPDVVHRRITDTCREGFTDAMGTKHCIARGYERRGFVEVDTGDKLSWTVQLTERPKVGIGGE